MPEEKTVDKQHRPKWGNAMPAGFRAICTAILVAIEVGQLASSWRCQAQPSSPSARGLFLCSVWRSTANLEHATNTARALPSASGPWDAALLRIDTSRLWSNQADGADQGILSCPPARTAEVWTLNTGNSLFPAEILAGRSTVVVWDICGDDKEDDYGPWISAIREWAVERANSPHGLRLIFDGRIVQAPNLLPHIMDYAETNLTGRRSVLYVATDHETLAHGLASAVLEHLGSCLLGDARLEIGGPDGIGGVPQMNDLLWAPGFPSNTSAPRNPPGSSYGYLEPQVFHSPELTSACAAPPIEVAHYPYSGHTDKVLVAALDLLPLDGVGIHDLGLAAHDGDIWAEFELWFRKHLKGQQVDLHLVPGRPSWKHPFGLLTPRWQLGSVVLEDSGMRKSLRLPEDLRDRDGTEKGVPLTLLAVKDDEVLGTARTVLSQGEDPNARSAP